MDHRFRRKARRKRGHAGILLLLLFLVAIVPLGRQWLSLRKIEIWGNYRYSEANILDIANIKLGQFIFNINTDEIESNFLGNGYVEFVSADIRLPDTLSLSVREREARAVADCMGTYVLIDENCIAMEQHGTMPDKQLPLVTGISLSRYRIGEALKSTEPGQIESLSRVITAIYEDGSQDKLAELNVRNLDNLYLMERDGFMIVLGDDTELEKKLVQMHQATQELNLRGITNGKLDVSGSKTIFAPAS